MTLDQLQNNIKLMIFDAELKPLPAKLVEQLSRQLRSRWIDLNRNYYETQGSSSASSAR